MISVKLKFLNVPRMKPKVKKYIPKRHADRFVMAKLTKIQPSRPKSVAYKDTTNFGFKNRKNFRFYIIR